jgi:phage protein U
VFAVLGDIPFQVVGSPEALSDSRTYDYAVLRVAQARPQLQWLADDLMTMRLEMLLHRSFTDPAASLLLLYQAAATHAALPLIFGNGDFRGYYVVIGIDTVARQLSGIGDPFAITVRLNLREAVVTFDPAAPPIPAFLPLAVSAVTVNSAASPALTQNGISALATLTAPSGPTSAFLLPDDVSISAIVRS